MNKTNGEARVPQAQGQSANDLIELIEAILGAGHVGAKAQWALRAAAEAGITEGISGALTLHIPANKRDHLEVTFTIGTVEVVSRWAG